MPDKYGAYKVVDNMPFLLKVESRPTIINIKRHCRMSFSQLKLNVDFKNMKSRQKFETEFVIFFNLFPVCTKNNNSNINIQWILINLVYLRLVQIMQIHSC